MNPPKTLDELRANIDPRDRQLLDYCWTHYRTTGEPISARDVHHRFRTKREAEEIAARLSRNLIRHGQSSRLPGEVFEIFYLGALASSDGSNLESLLIRFLTALKAVDKADHRTTLLPSKKLLQFLEATSEELTLLGRFLNLNFRPFGIYITSYDSCDSWNIAIGDEIADIREVESLADFFQQYVVREFQATPRTPAVEKNIWNFLDRNSQQPFGNFEKLEFSKSSPPAKQQPPDISFVRDDELRRISQESWKDAVVAQNSGLLKAAVILIGATAEGLLLDRLEHVPSEELRTAAREERIGRTLEEMGLDEMVRIADRLKVIRATSKHLAHFLREYRNTVHPGQQRRKRLELSTEDVSLAFSGLHALVRELNHNS